MKTKAIIFFLLLFSTLACSSANYAAAFNLDYEVTPSPPLELATSETMMVPNSPASRATALLSMSVCTGTENGTLRVRKGAGTSEAEIGLLQEGEQVEVLDEQTSENGTWAEIQKPQEGWVNKRFLCETKQ